MHSLNLGISGCRAAADCAAGEVQWGGPAGLHGPGAPAVDQAGSHHPSVHCAHCRHQQRIPPAEEHPHGLRAQGEHA